MDIYKPLNINIGTVMKNPGMLTFVPDHLKTKKMCKHAVKKWPYLLRYVRNQYRTQQSRNQEMCNKTVDNYPCALKLVRECFMTQEMCDKVVNTHSSARQFVPKWYETQKNVC